MNKFNVKRFLGYLLGVFLFYAPFAYYQKTLAYWIGAPPATNIHSFCLRIPLLNLLTGKGLAILSVAFISVLLLIGTAFFLGPFFCGRLCASGALPEYLSKIVPDRFKINWQESVNPVPIRYGFLAGFLITPLFGGSIACALCNYSFMERLVVGSIQGNIGFLGSTAIITGFLWLGMFGVIAKGGRGFCSHLCPVGAIQSAVHSLGARFGFTYKLRYARENCAGCGQCVKRCPMGAIEYADGGLTYQIHNCITCRQCAAGCKKKALSYGTGDPGWQNARSESYGKDAAVEAIK